MILRGSIPGQRATTGAACVRSAFAQCLQLAGELGACVAQAGVKSALVLGEEPRGALVCGAALRGDRRADGAAVVRISDASDVAVGLEAIDQLRHVRLAARVLLGELREGERCLGE